MTYAAEVTNLMAPNMSLFRDRSNRDVARLISESDEDAVRQASIDMRPTLRAIVRGEPYELPMPYHPEPRSAISRFLRRCGL